MEEVKILKEKCCSMQKDNKHPLRLVREIVQTFNIMKHLSTLSFADRPDYKYIREQLNNLLETFLH